MKTSAVIVVEGKTDVDFLSSFIEADFVTTNGSAVSQETLNYIESLSKTRDIIVLTDPDSPGKRIRDIVAERVPSVIHAFIPKEKAIRGKKVGVAESDKQTVEDALRNLIPNKPLPEATITAAMLYDLGLSGGSDSAALRAKVGTKLHFGPTNAKTFLKRVNALGVSPERLKEVMHE